MTVLITGASRGIGYELAKYFASRQAAVILLLSRNKEKLHELKNECHAISPGTQVVELPFDLGEEKDYVEIAERVTVEISHLDIFINNAGHLVNKPFDKITAYDLQKVYAVNVFGPFRLIQLLLPLMGINTKSHIVNIGSMGGVQGSAKFQGLSAYSSSKMALAGLTECLAEEFREKNISVNCLALGAVSTEMLAEAFPGYKAPLSAEEMAEFIGDFSLKGHKFFNGKILPVALTTP